MGRLGASRGASLVSPQGRDSRTRYEVLAKYQSARAELASPCHGGIGMTLLLVRPVTGRKHQIRAHFASVGRPLAGDSLYNRALLKEASWCPRVSQHCYR